MTPDISLNTGYKASHPKMPLEKKILWASENFFLSSAAGRVDFVCFQAFRPNKVPFYNFFIAGRSALKKEALQQPVQQSPYLHDRMSTNVSRRRQNIS